MGNLATYYTGYVRLLGHRPTILVFKNGLSCRAFALRLVFEEGTLLRALMDGCLAAAETQLDLDSDLVDALSID